MEIREYQLDLSEIQKIKLPEESEILNVSIRGEEGICLWVLVDPDVDDEEYRKIEIVGNGQPMDDDVEREYISTFQLDDGKLIFHVFEIK